VKTVPFESVRATSECAKALKRVKGQVSFPFVIEETLEQIKVVEIQFVSISFFFRGLMEIWLNYSCTTYLMGRDDSVPI